MRRAGAALLAATLAVAPAPAAEPECPPKLTVLRYDEDYSYLKDPALRRDPWDPLKFIALIRDRSSYVSIGGELRGRYEYFSEVSWGAGPRDANGHWLQRAMLHTDWHLGRHMRLFGQVKTGSIAGREGGARPPDEDRLDLNQAFVELSADAWTLRPGRQELAFGSARLISNREGPNVHLTFDAVRLTGAGDGWRVDGLAARPVETSPGVFDDRTEDDRSLWGAYAVRNWPGGGLGTDLYYLGYANDFARFDEGRAREVRHSAGTRLWSRGRPFDYNFELVFQWGRFGSGAIRAWTAASDTGYTADDLPGSPRFGLRADATSGDRAAGDGRLETFNPLFPRGSYFGEIALIGPYNHIDAHPGVMWRLPRGLELTAECDFFWRQSRHDGVYSPAGALLRSGGRSRARYVGSQPSLMAEWKADRHLTLAAAFTRFFAGRFLEETAPGRDIDYASTWATYKF